MLALKRPQIALPIDTATDRGRRIIRSIARDAMKVSTFIRCGRTSLGWKAILTCLRSSYFSSTGDLNALVQKF